MDCSGLVSDNDDKNNPFTRRVQLYIYREVGNRNQPWNSDFNLYFGDEDTGLLNLTSRMGTLKYSRYRFRRML